MKKKISGLNLSSHNGIIANVKANEYIFAMGIENSRYLLWFKKYKNILFLMTTNRKILDGTPSFTLGQAIVDRRKVNEEYYSYAEAQKYGYT